MTATTPLDRHCADPSSKFFDAAPFQDHYDQRLNASADVLIYPSIIVAGFGQS